MTDFTIITTEAELRLEADYFKFDDAGDLYLYEGDATSNADGESVGHVPSGRFVAIFETESGDTTPPNTQTKP